MELYPHQQISKQFLLDKKRCILADSPRVGKTTPTAAAALEQLPVLVVCPAIVKSVWSRAFEQLDSSKKQRIISGKKDAEIVGNAEIVIINYDLLGSIKQLGKFNTVIFDECHRIKNPKAIRTKAALKLMKKIPNVYCLSGTLIPNRPVELFPIISGLGIYRGSWHDYIYRYCKAWSSPWGLDYSGASNLPELKEFLEPHVLRRTKEDVFKDYQEPIVSLITFDLPVDKREQEFDADALINHPNPLLAFEGLATVMREAGMKKLKPSLEFIEDKLQDGEPVIIFVHHKDLAKELHSALKNYDPVIVIGDTPKEEREKNIKLFQSGQSKVIIGNIQSMSEGVDLSISDTVIFVETTWSTSALEQASSRVENINKQGKAPLIYILTIARSLDHVILGKIIKKQNIINQII